MNRVYACLAHGAGLDAAIIDAKDVELVRILRMLDAGVPQSSLDNLYINLSEMIKNFGEIEDIKFDQTCIEEQNIIKTAGYFAEQKIYYDSFTQV